MREVRSGVCVQGLSCESEVRLAHCFVLRGVRVDEGRDIGGVGFPVDDQLCFTDLLADTSADDQWSENPRTDMIMFDVGKSGKMHSAIKFQGVSIWGEGTYRSIPYHSMSQRARRATWQRPPRRGRHRARASTSSSRAARRCVP